MPNQEPEDAQTIDLNLFRLSLRSADLLVATVLINMLSLALPLTMMQVYDRIIANRTVDTLVWLIVGCIVALLLEGALRIVRAFISAYMAARFEHTAGCQAVHKILNSRLDAFDQDGPSTHLDRLNAVGALRGFYAGQAFQVLMDLPFALLFLIAVGYLGGIIVLVPVCVILAFLATAVFLNRRFKAAREQQIEANERRTGFVVEVLSRIHTLKAVSMEEQMLRRYEKLQASGAQSDMNVGLWTMLPANLGSMFSQAAFFGVICIGAGQVMNGTLTIGVLTACSLLSTRAMQPILSIAGFLLRFSEVRLAQGRFEKILQLEDEGTEGLPTFPADVRGAIELRDVSFRPTPDLPDIFQEVSLTVPAGAMVAIHGANLRGTSTLLQLMLGLRRPSQGTVLIDGLNLSGWDYTSLRGRVGYIPQSAALFKGTILDNITMFDTDMRSAALDAAGLVGLDELVARLPMGYETPVTAQASSLLPGDVVHRVAIARTLVVRPRILLLDKIDTAMDRDSQTVFRWLLEHLKGKCTIVIVTDQPNLLELSDEAYELTGTHLEPSEFLVLLREMQEFKL